MPAQPQVPINWHWIDYEPEQGSARTKCDLKNQGADLSLIDKSVYVIRLKSPFSINYPNKHTPTIYIGEGKLIDRLRNHEKWIKRLQQLGYAFKIEVACCFPRTEADPRAHRVFEAHLLKQFLVRFGSLPLKNSIPEHISLAHEFSRSAVGEVLGPGKGAKHKWAIQPLTTNPFKRVFEKTHRTQ